MFLIAVLGGADARAITMDWSLVTVGNAAIRPPGRSTVLSATQYNIGTYDVTVSQYVAFLNSNDPTGAKHTGAVQQRHEQRHLWRDHHTSAAANGDKYSVVLGDGNHPANYVTFYDTLRFANWLNNGQTPGSTETGAYTLLGGTATPSNAADITGTATATVFLPNEDEWYKAAYYNPATSSYYLYPTSSNTLPTARRSDFEPQLDECQLPRHIPTDVCAYSGTTSPTAL